MLELSLPLRSVRAEEQRRAARRAGASDRVPPELRKRPQDEKRGGEARDTPGHHGELRTGDGGDGGGLDVAEAGP